MQLFYKFSHVLAIVSLVSAQSSFFQTSSSSSSSSQIPSQPGHSIPSSQSNINLDAQINQVSIGMYQQLVQTIKTTEPFILNSTTENAINSVTSENPKLSVPIISNKMIIKTAVQTWFEQVVIGPELNDLFRTEIQTYSNEILTHQRPLPPTEELYRQELTSRLNSVLKQHLKSNSCKTKLIQQLKTLSIFQSTSSDVGRIISTTTTPPSTNNLASTDNPSNTNPITTSVDIVRHRRFKRSLGFFRYNLGMNIFTKGLIISLLSTIAIAIIDSVGIQMGLSLLIPILTTSVGVMLMFGGLYMAIKGINQFP